MAEFYTNKIKELKKEEIATIFTKEDWNGIENLRNNSMAIGITEGKNAEIGKDMRGNSIVVGATKGEHANIGTWMFENSVAIGITKGKRADVGQQITDNSIVIGLTTGLGAAVGRYARGKSIVIGVTKGMGAHMGEIIGEDSIAMGVTRGDLASIGHSMHKDSVAIGVTKGKGAKIGSFMRDNSVAIGIIEGAPLNPISVGFNEGRIEHYTILGAIEGKKTEVSRIMMDNSVFIGFEYGKFVVKIASKIPSVPEYVISPLNKDDKEKIKILKNLLLQKNTFANQDVLSEKMFEKLYTNSYNIDPLKWAKNMSLENYRKKQILPALENLQKTRKIILNKKQLCPIDGKYGKRAIALLAQIGELEHIRKILETARDLLVKFGTHELAIKNLNAKIERFSI